MKLIIVFIIALIGTTYATSSKVSADQDKVEGVLHNDESSTYIAIYDYTAEDDDEVSFQAGDIITNGEPIDEGWMNGTVKRTGQSGMLPSNYVEPI